MRDHSGVLGNEIADGLCDRAHREGHPPCPTVVTEATRHSLLLRGLPTTGHPRWVVKKQSQALRQAELRQASQLRRACPPTGCLDLGLSLLRPRQVRSFKDSLRYSFRVKLVTATLPTMERQGTWHSSVYPNTLCRRCHAAPETVDHLLACPVARPALAAIPSTLPARLAALDDSLDHADTSAIISAISPTLDHNALKGFGDVRWEPALEAAGLRPVQKMLRMLVDCLAALTFDHIWLPRCDATISWERAHRIYRRDKRAMASSGDSQPSHLTPLPPIPLADFFSVLPGVVMA